MVGRKVESHKWSEGWTTAEFYTIYGTTYLFLLKEKGVSHERKNVYIHEMNDDGRVGIKREYHRWTEGWSTASFYSIGGTTYIFLLKKTGIDPQGNNVTIHEMKTGGAHAVAVDGYKEDDDGTFWICVKWGHDSPNNSDSKNPGNTPWFELERAIVKVNTNRLDGKERRFISIQPIMQPT